MMALMDGIEDIDIDVHIVDAVVRLTQWHPIWSFCAILERNARHCLAFDDINQKNTRILSFC